MSILQETQVTLASTTLRCSHFLFSTARLFSRPPFTEPSFVSVRLGLSCLHDASENEIGCTCIQIQHPNKFNCSPRAANYRPTIFYERRQPLPRFNLNMGVPVLCSLVLNNTSPFHSNSPFQVGVLRSPTGLKHQLSTQELCQLQLHCITHSLVVLEIFRVFFRENHCTELQSAYRPYKFLCCAVSQFSRRMTKHSFSNPCDP